MKTYQALMQDIGHMRRTMRYELGEVTSRVLRGRIRETTFVQLYEVFEDFMRSDDPMARRDLLPDVEMRWPGEQPASIYRIPIAIDAFIPEGVILFETEPLLYAHREVNGLGIRASSRYEVEVSLV